MVNSALCGLASGSRFCFGGAVRWRARLRRESGKPTNTKDIPQPWEENAENPVWKILVPPSSQLFPCLPRKWAVFKQKRDLPRGCRGRTVSFFPPLLTYIPIYRVRATRRQTRYMFGKHLYQIFKNKRPIWRCRLCSQQIQEFFVFFLFY